MNCVFFLIVFVAALFPYVLLEGSITTSKSGQTIEKETKSECDQVISDQFGVIRSPGYPEKYPRYSRCQYIIQRYSTDTCEIKLTIQRFDVAKMIFSNCSADFFEIQNDRKRYKVCGELPSGSKKFVFFPDNSDSLVFKFQSTFHQKRGFSIEIKQLPFSCKKATTTMTHDSMRAPPSCNVEVRGRTGRFTYPMDNSGSTEQCTFKIIKSEAQACAVQLDFSSFEITPSANCETNYLQLPGGQRLCGTLGGSRKMLQFPPGSDELVLEFVTRAENNDAFDIQVSQLPGPCDYESASNRTGTLDDSEKNNLF